MGTLIVVNSIPGRDLPMSNLRLAFPVCCALLASAAFAAPLELRVLKMDGTGAAGTVIVLRSIDAARPLARPVDATMDQVDLQFVPHVLVVPTGSKVFFNNTDSVRHQIHSFSKPNKFELPLFSGKYRDPKVFDHAGVVTVGCNIHDNMRASVYVVDAQYFGRSDASGIWKSADIPPGTSSVQVGHPLARDLRPVLQERNPMTAEETKLSLRITTKLKLRPATQIPGNWDVY
jgi:plastocyanin